MKDIRLLVRYSGSGQSCPAALGVKRWQFGGRNERTR